MLYLYGNQCQLFGQRSFHYLIRQEVRSSFTNLHGQKAVINELMIRRYPLAGLLGTTRNASTFILPAESDELKQEKYR